VVLVPLPAHRTGQAHFEHPALGHAGKKTNINKSEISIVRYIRPKPLSDFAEYSDDELAWMKVFDPQLWPRMLHLQSMSIRLHDSSLPQDDSTIVCTPGAGDITRKPAL